MAVPPASPKAADALRPVRFERQRLPFAEGSVLVAFGRTEVLCAASVVEGVPPWMAGRGAGWLTGEYSMLPRSTPTRKPRATARPDARGLEIQRLIGRALRAAVELGYLGERTLHLDCDVLVADGGTRTAAITGGMLALADALLWMKRRKLIPGVPLKGLVAAVSVGLVAGAPRLDLCYEEDSAAEADLNVVMTEAGGFVELQGTGEKRPFRPEELKQLLALAKKGLTELFALQRQALGEEALAELGLR